MNRRRNILFISPADTASRMAEAIARRLAPPQVRVYSTSPAPRPVPAHAAKVMREVGLEIPDRGPRGAEAVPLAEIDLAISLGEKPATLPGLSSRARLCHWPIPNPERASGGESAMQAVYRLLRDEIDRKVAALFLDYWRCPRRH